MAIEFSDLNRKERSCLFPSLCKFLIAVVTRYTFSASLISPKEVRYGFILCFYSFLYKEKDNASVCQFLPVKLFL